MGTMDMLCWEGCEAMPKLSKHEQDSMVYTKRVAEALNIAWTHGGTDGAHHKAWVIDQMVRALTGPGYKAWVKTAKAGEDGPETYEWDEGIAP